MVEGIAWVFMALPRRDQRKDGVLITLRGARSDGSSLPVRACPRRGLRMGMTALRRAAIVGVPSALLS